MRNFDFPCDVKGVSRSDESELERKTFPLQNKGNQREFTGTRLSAPIKPLQRPCFASTCTWSVCVCLRACVQPRVHDAVFAGA